jgi:hypothetical protein
MTDKIKTLVVEGATEAAGAIDKFATSATAALDTSMPNTPPAIKTDFQNLLAEIKAIPGEVTGELAVAEEKILAAISWVVTHFRIADAAVQTDVASIKTDAGAMESAVEKAV